MLRAIRMCLRPIAANVDNILWFLVSLGCASGTNLPQVLSPYYCISIAVCISSLVPWGQVARDLQSNIALASTFYSHKNFEKKVKTDYYMFSLNKKCLKIV